MDKPIKITKHRWPKKTIPLVSISCITYNHENYIRNAIEGFLMQETTFPVEINIHDDASTDSTASIIREYEEKFPHLQFNPIYQTENQFSKRDGTIAKIQRGRSKGKYYATCEGDDYWTDPLKLQKQVEFLEANEDYSMVYQRWVEKEGDEIRIPENNFVSTHTRLFRNIDFSAEYNKMGNVLNGDVVHAFLLSHYGKFKCIEDLEPAVYRRDSGGIWNSLNEHKKAKAYYHTAETLYKAFKGTKYAQKAIDRYIKTCKMPNIKKALNLSEIDTIKLFYNEGFLNEYIKISLMSFKKSIILFIRKYIPK